MAGASLTVLHLAPHPDDEAIGAPATLLRLRDAGHRIVNLACSLGRPEDHSRRRAEVEEACRRAGFDLRVHEPPLRISSGDDRAAAQQELAGAVGRLVDELGAGLVVAPSPHDGHYGHEVVGRAARDALARDGAPRLWMWGLWADLPLPTLFVPFGEEELARGTYALCAHAGELARNAYTDLVRARATAARVLGAERVFGFGEEGRPVRYAELLTEAAFASGRWWAGVAREPDPAGPLMDIPEERPLGWWMAERSFSDRLEEERRREAERRAAVP